MKVYGSDNMAYANLINGICEIGSASEFQCDAYRAPWAHLRSDPPEEKGKQVCSFARNYAEGSSFESGLVHNLNFSFFLAFWMDLTDLHSFTVD